MSGPAFQLEGDTIRRGGGTSDPGGWDIYAAPGDGNFEFLVKTAARAAPAQSKIQAPIQVGQQRSPQMIEISSS